VTLGFKKSGFIHDPTADHLEVVWMPDCIFERLSVADAENLLRVAHGASLSESGQKTNLQGMEEMLALHRIETAVRERGASCKNEAEKKSLDLLIKRCFATDGCEWDKAHSGELFHLAVKPSEVGLMFRLQEKVHRLFCKRH
jgi:hypothetical protein